MPETPVTPGGRGAVTGPIRRRSQDVAAVEAPDRVALVRLFDPAAAPLVFEGTAAAIWHSLDGTRDLTALVADMSSTFQAPEDVVRPAVRAFVEELDRLALLDSSAGVAS